MNDFNFFNVKLKKVWFPFDFAYLQFPYFTCALRKVQDLREQKYFKTKYFLQKC